jgi:hypothetical protein
MRGIAGVAVTTMTRAVGGVVGLGDGGGAGVAVAVTTIAVGVGAWIFRASTLAVGFCCGAGDGGPPTEEKYGATALRAVYPPTRRSRRAPRKPRRT